MFDLAIMEYVIEDMKNEDIELVQVELIPNDYQQLELMVYVNYGAGEFYASQLHRVAIYENHESEMAYEEADALFNKIANEVGCKIRKLYP